MNEAKALLKAISPTLYDKLLLIRRSEALRFTASAPAIPARLYSQTLNHPYFPVDLRGEMGMGAMLSILVRILSYCDDKKLIPIIRFSNPLYSLNGSDDTDWFPLYFDMMEESAQNKAISGRQLHFHTIYHEWNYRFFGIKDDISLQRAHTVFTKYVRINQNLSDTADELFNSWFGKSTHVLGVHYRGTDKRYESPTVQWEHAANIVEGKLNNVASKRGVRVSQIFLASDEDKFIDFIKHRFPDITFHTYMHPSISGGGPRHFSSGAGKDKAVEAILNILILARCNYCVKTASHLSAWAKILNPDLDVTMLNRPFRGSYVFPDKGIWEAQLQQQRL